MIYRKDTYVPASMCNGETKLSVMAVFQLVEDAVTELMGDLRIDGITAMREYGAMWVFVKNNIRIFRLPAWREPFTIRGFISSHTAAKLQIDTELTDEKGDALVHSRLELCALDLETGRIRKAATVGVTDDIECGEPLPDMGFARFPRAELSCVESVTVRSTNLDYCSHTNNIEYVRFILNTYSAAQLAARSLDRIEMHYGSQSFEGDALQLWRAETAEGDLVSVRRDGASAADCLLRWSEK